ncbi:bifunctional folylpolyglutamate synthase/dihydrofolate synthase [Streptococcus suis]|nr:bifunctional folylpolyglutamate synthase/dihydrofolate synthase [Streptococcus suis]
MLEKWLTEKQGQQFRYKMEKIEYALALLGNPHLEIPVIHVAGTNGKGSTIAFMNHLFQYHGLRVGTFVSPHLVTVHDRICMNGQAISPDDFKRYLQEVYQLEKKIEGRYEPFRYFEVMVLVMFLYFRDKKPDLALIEVGIGGLLDTTNVVSPVVSIITSIGMDHQDLLGSTLKEIAEQKAGIIKDKVPVVLGPLTEECLSVCQQIASTKDAPVYQFGNEFVYNNNHFESEYLSVKDLILGLVGQHQEENAAVALQTFLLYMQHINQSVDVTVIRQALVDTCWAGRLELVHENPIVYLDGAHNVPAVERLAEFVNTHQTVQATILFSALKRKDFKEMVEMLETKLPQASLILTSFSYDGALSKDTSEGRMYVADYQQFIREWLEHHQGMLVITGSLYFISEVRRMFR